MEICTAGGVIRGYWATGKMKSATAPMSVIATDITVAKIGRSMKKCENIGRLSLHAACRINAPLIQAPAERWAAQPRAARAVALPAARAAKSAARASADSLPES